MINKPKSRCGALSLTGCCVQWSFCTKKDVNISNRGPFSCLMKRLVPWQRATVNLGSQFWSENQEIPWLFGTRKGSISLKWAGVPIEMWRSWVGGLCSLLIQHPFQNWHTRYLLMPDSLFCFCRILGMPSPSRNGIRNVCCLPVAIMMSLSYSYSLSSAISVAVC